MARDSSQTTSPRIAVMLSGSGRTLDNLLLAIGEGRLNASIVVVIASRECLGAAKARAAGIETLVMPGVIEAGVLVRTLVDRRIDWVVLAGYLKYIHVPTSFAGRVVNIHPSLLPAFGGPGMYGDRVHAAVIAAGAAESGCTVHLVDDVYDHGRVVLQRSCPVLPGDSARTLAARVFVEECIAYPAALQHLFAGGVASRPAHH